MASTTPIEIAWECTETDLSIRYDFQEGYVRGLVDGPKSECLSGDLSYQGFFRRELVVSEA